MSFLDHPAIASYQTNLAALKAAGHITETQTRAAFRKMLERICDERDLLFVEEFPVGKNGRKKVDGAVRDRNSSLGYWEAKDEKDDLETEIKRKIAAGYPLSNTIFEDTRRAILWQNFKQIESFDLTKPAELADLLARFFNHSEADRESFESGVRDFLVRIPQLAGELLRLIEGQSANKKFQTAFGSFYATCKTALDPNIKESVVREMLVQHLLTERLFRVVFQNAEWATRNVIAAEIDSVIEALASHKWSRGEFLRSLDPFYKVIEDRARGLSYSEKQSFLNTVYERFFKGYSTETADTMGIVYTPQEIVDWMCESVEQVLKDEWGKTLATPDVKILDPCVGTGNFIVNLLNRIPADHLPAKYGDGLFANEIMLLPYYVASGNIEHEYFEKLGEYRAFDGLCFADTLDLFQGAQMPMFVERNTARVEKQKESEITVIIGNPPYNVGQKNENDNNKNRSYKGIKGSKGIDDLIRETYAKASNATLQNKLYDPYVRFFKWASERLKNPDGTLRDGVVCFVSNNSFVHKNVFDGMRKHLGDDFNHIWHLDLGGDARSGGGGNVFDIMVGVGITIMAHNSQSTERFIRYHLVPQKLKRDEKLKWLEKSAGISGVEWQKLTPNSDNDWLTEGLEADFKAHIPIGSKEAKASSSPDIKTVFRRYSTGVNTARDGWVYEFRQFRLGRKVNRFAAFYNSEVERWKNQDQEALVDNFVTYDHKRIKWSRNLKNHLRSGKVAKYRRENIRKSLYRPFCKQWLYFADVLVDERSGWPRLLPKADTKNRIIVLSDKAHRSPFSVLMTDCIPDLHLCATTDLFQCFPLYTYGPDGADRMDNVSSFALSQARERFGDSVSREDVFYATYAWLHLPSYRLKYAENLKRELPRLPLGDARVSPTAWPELVRIGRQLGDLHVGYESVEPHPLPLKNTTPEGRKFSFTVEKMRFNADRSALVVNDSISLSGFTSEMFEYRLGNRSALDWVVESYRVKRDERSGLTSDPNRAEEPRFILDLVGRVAAVSLATQSLVGELRLLFGDE